MEMNLQKNKVGPDWSKVLSVLSGPVRTVQKNSMTVRSGPVRSINLPDRCISASRLSYLTAV